MIIIIYLDTAMRNRYVIRPYSDQFKMHDVGKLVEHITKSDHVRGIRNYHKYEIY